MRVALTVSPGRVTAPGEVARLLDPLEPVLQRAGLSVTRWQPPALPWLDWVAFRDAERAQGLPEGADLIVGFELPDSLKRTHRGCVDLRRHPVRFLGDLWSVADHLGPLGQEELGPLAVAIPEQPRAAEYASMGAFACQVSHDSALMRRGTMIRPADVLEGLRAFTERFEGTYVAPHPLEPRGPWVDAALSLPRALLSPWPTYNLLARVRNVCTVTSSVGVEAAYFGCETTWLARPIDHGAPIARLDDPALWSLLLARAARKVAA